MSPAVALGRGGQLYLSGYRLAVRPYLESARLTTINGTFEVKEQFVTIRAGMLPLSGWSGAPARRKVLAPAPRSRRSRCASRLVQLSGGHRIEQRQRLVSGDEHHAVLPIFAEALRDHLRDLRRSQLGAGDLSSRINEWE